MTTILPEIQQWLEDAVAPNPKLSLSLGIIQGGQLQTHHFGQTHPPADDTLYEIGSLTKVFTAILLASFGQQNLIYLDDPVNLHLTDLPNFPKAITPLRLTTHTSGLPRLPRNLWWSILKNPANPYLNYHTPDLYKFLRRYRESKRNLKRIGQFEYSNLGVGLLGHILATIAQTPYEQLVAQYITQPLGLENTTIQLSWEQQNRLIPGYPPNSKPKTQPTSTWDLPAIPGAGALRSTIVDVLKFAAANLHATDECKVNQQAANEQTVATLVAAMAQCQAPQHKVTPKTQVDADLTGETQIGLGWFIRPLKETPLTLHWHDGGTGGYQSYCAFSKAEKLAVVMLANCAPAFGGKGFSANVMGDKIIRQLWRQQRRSPDPDA